MKCMLTAALASLFIMTGIGLAKEDSPGQEPAVPIKSLMHRKLENSQAILEGLTHEDYELVAKNARALKLLSLESGWNVIQTEEYELHSQQFRQAADSIAAAAAAKDVGRATDGYVNLTVRCIKCHSYMRAHRNRVVPPETR